MNGRRPPAAGTAVPARQMVLQFPLNTRFRLEDFVAGGNAELLSRLRALPAQAGFQGCCLSGPPGVGKTHLLQAVCQLAADAGQAVICLPLGDPAVQPALLDGLDSFALVALDDLDAWLGDAERERALLALYQGLVSRSGSLLVAAAKPAAQLETHYPDLLSRLRALAAYGVQPLDDAGKAQVLERLAAERGLALARPVLDYWFSRGARDLPGLIGQLERLDAAAMAAQRRITVPLLKSVLGL